MSRRVGKPAFGKWSWDDTGNAERLVERYDDRLCWVGDNNAWAVYDNTTGLWGLYGVGHSAAGLMRKTLERMRKEEAGHYSPEKGKGERSERERWLAWCATQGSAKAIQNGLSVAKTKRGVAARMADFDQDEGLLHVPNGVLDLNTYELMDHSPDYMLTVGAAAEYHPHLEDTMWQEYLDTFLPDQRLRRYVQKLFGYSLLVGNPERLFLMVLGPSSSGKSTLNELFSAAMGGYAQAVSLALFKANVKPGAPRSDLADALNARYVSATEASQQWRLHADEIKRITGADTMAARHIGEKGYVRRRPAFTPFIFTNSMPTIEGRDVAFDRRLRVVPFLHSVLNNGEDKRKTDRMLKSSKTLAAVLAWAVEGLRLYRVDGLETPGSVQQATKKAAGEMSDLDRFLSARCVERAGLWVRREELYRAYREWCISNDIKEKDVLSNTAFGSAMNARGYTPKQLRIDGTKTWVRTGLRLHNPGA